jgi:CheY-like chemotaxis protein
MTQIKLLWIDDNLDHDLLEKRMALMMVDDFDPHFARDATEAFYRLRKEQFDVVIFDLRLPSGPDDMWEKYRNSGNHKLGFELLKTISSNIGSEFNHLAKAKFGVFTLELSEENPELFKAPINLPKNNFKMKTHAYYESAFIDFIRTVYRA